MKKSYVLKLEGKEWKDILDKALKKKLKDAKIDGFRKGNVPKEVYLKKYGIESLYMDSVDNAVDVLFGKLMADKDTIVPAATPSIDIKDVNENFIEVEFTLVSSPEVKLGKYKNLGLKKETVKVSKEEINHELEHLKSHFVDIKVLEDDAKVKKGNIANINFEGFVNGKAFDGGKGENYDLEIGSNTFIPGFEDAVIGMKKGETKDINVKFPDNYQAENLKGKDAVFKVTVNEIKEKVMPELNKEFFEDLNIKEVTNEEELLKYIEEGIKKEKENKNKEKYTFECLDKIRENSKFEIPEEMINDEVNRMFNEFSENLKRQGLDINTYLKFTNSDMDKFKETFKGEADRRIGYRILIEEIIKAEKIEVSDEELDKDIEKYAKEYNISKEEYLKEIGSKDNYRYNMIAEKAINLITE